MRLPLIPPADLSPEQRPLYESMRDGIEKYFRGFASIANNGALMGPWAPWLHEPKFSKLVWDLTLALSISPSLPRNAREVAILVTGTTFHSGYELYAHVFVAETRGLSDDKLSTIIAGHRPSDLTRGGSHSLRRSILAHASWHLARDQLSASREAIRWPRRGRIDLSRGSLLHDFGDVEWFQCARSRY